MVNVCCDTMRDAISQTNQKPSLMVEGMPGCAHWRTPTLVFCPWCGKPWHREEDDIVQELLRRVSVIEQRLDKEGSEGLERYRMARAQQEEMRLDNLRKQGMVTD